MTLGPKREGMIGRVYRWRGSEWRVLARWRTPPLAERTPACSGCGYVGPDVFCECVPMPDADYGPRVVRNVLIENTTTGERVTRPFRGLRRLRSTPEQSAQ